MHSHNQKQQSNESPNHRASVPASTSLKEHLTHQPKWTPSQPIIPIDFKDGCFSFHFSQKSINIHSSLLVIKPEDNRVHWHRKPTICIRDKTKILLVPLIVLSDIFLMNENLCTTSHELKCESTTRCCVFVDGLRFIFGALMKSDPYTSAAMMKH